MFGFRFPDSLVGNGRPDWGRRWPGGLPGESGLGLDGRSGQVGWAGLPAFSSELNPGRFGMADSGSVCFGSPVDEPAGRVQVEE